MQFKIQEIAQLLVLCITEKEKPSFQLKSYNHSKNVRQRYGKVTKESIKLAVSADKW